MNEIKDNEIRNIVKDIVQRKNQAIVETSPTACACAYLACNVAVAAAAYMSLDIWIKLSEYCFSI